jgi:multidrug resistance efflux pump
MKRRTEQRTKIHHKLKVFRWLIGFTLVLIIGAITLLMLGSMEDSVQAQGRLEGIREYRFRSMVTSKVLEAPGSEGDVVKRGDVLLRFDPRKIDDQILLQGNVIAELNARIQVKQEEYAILLKDPLPTHYRHALIALEELRKRTQKSKQELEIYARLFERKVVSRREYQKIELEHLTNSSQLKRAESDYKKVREGLGGKILAKAKCELDLLRLMLVGEKKKKDMLISHLEDYEIKAPETGIITSLPYKPGAYVQTGDIAIAMAATKQKKFVAMVSEKQIYKIQPGQKVRIVSSQYNYFDYGYFGGEVIDIEQLPIKQDKTNFYPVKILVTHEPQPLKLGSTSKIEIIVGRDRIISCLLGLNK